MLILKYCKQKPQRPSNKLFGFVWDSLQDRIVLLANKRSERYKFTLKQISLVQINAGGFYGTQCTRNTACLRLTV